MTASASSRRTPSARSPGTTTERPASKPGVRVPASTSQAWAPARSSSASPCPTSKTKSSGASTSAFPLGQASAALSAAATSASPAWVFRRCAKARAAKASAAKSAASATGSCAPARRSGVASRSSRRMPSSAAARVAVTSPGTAPPTAPASRAGGTTAMPKYGTATALARSQPQGSGAPRFAASGAVARPAAIDACASPRTAPAGGFHSRSPATATKDIWNEASKSAAGSKASTASAASASPFQPGPRRPATSATPPAAAIAAERSAGACSPHRRA